MHWRKKLFENIVEKEGNTGNQHSLPFPKCFLSYEKTTLMFQVIFNLLSANALGKPKILSSGKGLCMYREG